MDLKKSVLLVIAAIGIAGIVLYLVQSGNVPSSPVATATTFANTPQAADTPGTIPVSPAVAANATPAIDPGRLTYNTESFKAMPLPERLKAMSARRGGRVFNPEDVAKALQSDLAWEPDNSAADKLGVTKEERSDGREFFHVNPLKIEALMPGDEMSLPIRQAKPDGPLRIVVDTVDEGDPTNITWHGHTKYYETENQITFTRADTLIVGGVTLPDKNYVVQINGDAGWVADGFTLFKGRHDAIKPGQDDAVPPPHTHTH
jgi:hypothetical protein